jgi:prepilin-type N-terminal cleavage/methylation domain-containing protein
MKDSIPTVTIDGVKNLALESSGEPTHRPISFPPRGSPVASSERGFSLIELLITTLVMTIVLGSVLYLSNQSLARQDFESERLSVQQNANEALDQMYRDIRMVGYPQSRLFANSLGWSYSNSNKVASGFTTINSSNVVFQGDIDNDGVVEVVEYRLNGTSLERSEVEKNSDGTVPSAIYQLLAPNVTALSFTYYRLNSGNWTTTGVTAANSSRVDISLTMQTGIKDPQSRQYRTVTFQTSTIARNLE